MYLKFESGRTIEDVTEDDLCAEIFEDELHAILSVDDQTFIQCHWADEDGDTLLLEYQDGSIHRHYYVGDGPVPLDRVLVAFQKYLRGDESWRFDFAWEKLELWNFNFLPPEGEFLPVQRIPDLIEGTSSSKRRFLPQKRFGRRPPFGRKKRNPRSN